jgi:ClpX C4-type zinc finger
MSSPTDDDEPDDELTDEFDDLEDQVVIELDEELEVARCSFCGRSAFEVDRLVAQGDARICNLCIKEFRARLKPNPKPSG